MLWACSTAFSLFLSLSEARRDPLELVGSALLLVEAHPLSLSISRSPFLGNLRPTVVRTLWVGTAVCPQRWDPIRRQSAKPWKLVGSSLLIRTHAGATTWRTLSAFRKSARRMTEHTCSWQRVNKRFQHNSDQTVFQYPRMPLEADGNEIFDGAPAETTMCSIATPSQVNLPLQS